MSAQHTHTHTHSHTNAGTATHVPLIEASAEFHKKLIVTIEIKSFGDQSNLTTFFKHPNPV